MRKFVSVFDRKIRKTPVPYEQNECIILNGYLELLQQRHDFYYSHIANGGKRFRKTAIILKKMGVKKGVWDYLIRAPGVAQTWLEMKHGSNKLTTEQIEFSGYHSQFGDRFVVAYKAEEAIRLLAHLGIFPRDSFFFSASGAFFLHPHLYPQISKKTY